MMGKKILLIILLGMFIINFVSAIDCRPKIKINIGIYHEGGESENFERSLFHPAGVEGIIQEGDYLLIESFYFSINNSCNVGKNIVVLLKNPKEDGFSSIAYVPLENSWVEEGLIKYSFKLVDFNVYNLNAHEDNKGNHTNCCAPKKLSVEGEWEVKVLYDKNEIYSTLFNENRPLPRKLDVRNRLSLEQLETLKQLRDDSERDSWRSLFVVIAIGFATIFFMWKIGNKQIKKMEEHYEKQTKKEDKREEEKQASLLKGMKTCIEAIKEDIGGHKIELGKNTPEILKRGDLILPSYSLTSIPSQTYLSKLNLKIKGNPTKSLIKSIIKAQHKIENINDLLKFLQNPSLSQNAKMLNFESLRENSKYYKDLKDKLEILEKEIEKILNNF